MTEAALSPPDRRFGSGWISGSMAAVLGPMCLGAVLCLRFPSLLTSPHLREIYPMGFVRGLIHSDDCRTVDRFKTRLPSGRVAEYAYPRYFFSNLSADVRGLFCESCERLGLRWTQSNHRNISISHRTSVARLDENVGPKC